MAATANYSSVVAELEQLLTDQVVDLSSVLKGAALNTYFLLPQGGVLEFSRYGQHGIHRGGEEALLCIYDLDGVRIASYTKGFEPWHVFAMRLPSALFDFELHALRSRPNFLAKPNWEPRSLAAEMAKTIIQP